MFLKDIMRSTTLSVSRLLLAGVGALCVLPSAASAQSLPYAGLNPSLQSENSFFLFRGEFDYLQDPARLANGDNSSLYTLLTNQNGGAYSLGLRTPVGPGTVGFYVNVSGRSTAELDVVVEVDQSTDQVTDRLTSTAFTRSRTFNFYAGYGMGMGNVRLGVGTRVNLATSAASVDEDLNYGSANYVYEDLEANETETVEGSVSGASNSFLFVLSGESGDSDGLLLQGDLYMGVASTQSTVNMSYDASEYFASVEGIYSTAPGSNQDMVLLGLELNPEYRMSKTLAFELFAAAEVGFPALATREVTYFEAATAGAFDVTQTQVLSNTANEQGYWAGSFQLMGRFDVTPTAQVRLGVGYTQNHWLQDYNTSTSSEILAENADPITSELVTQYRSVSDTQALLLPVSLEVKLTDKMRLRLGARYTLLGQNYQDAYQQVSFVVNGESQPVDGTQPTSNYGQWTPYLSHAVGLNFQPNPRVDVDLMLSNFGSSVARGNYTSGSALNLYGSATLHW